MHAPVAEDTLVFNLQCLQRGTARKRFRREILDAWDNRCAYCNCERAHTLDHVQPKARGGPTKRNNLVACCAACNIEKTDIPFMEWFRAQTFWTEDRELKILSWIMQVDQENFEDSKYNELCQTFMLLPAAS